MLVVQYIVFPSFLPQFLPFDVVGGFIALWIHSTLDFKDVGHVWNVVQTNIDLSFM